MAASEWEDAPGDWEDAPSRRTPLQMGGPTDLDVAASKARSFLQGVKDPITGAAQWLESALPAPVVKAGNSLNNWLAQYGLVSEVPPGGVTEMARRENAQIEAERKAVGRGKGVDWFRLGGNVASPTNLAIARAVGNAPALANTLGGRIALGAAQGAAGGAINPVTESVPDMGRERAKNALIGMGAGMAAPVVTNSLARMVSPRGSPEVRTLIDAGVLMTPGQAMGGAARRMEERLSSVPVVGDIIKSAERQGIESYDRAVINRALAHVNDRLPRNVDMGYDAVNYMHRSVSGAWDRVLPQLRGAVDPPLARDLAGVRVLGQNLPREQADELTRIIDREVIDQFTNAGLASGRTVRSIESRLRGIASSLGRSDNYHQRDLGNAVREVQASLHRMLERQNPSRAAELNGLDAAWSDLLRIERAAGYRGAKEGLFTPSHHASATKALDASKNKSATSQGRATGQELPRAGEAVMRSNVPDSGTPGRIAAALLLESPKRLGLPLAAGALMAPAYSPMGMRAFQYATNVRPPGANALAELVRQSSPTVAAGGVPLSMLPGAQNP